MEGGLGSRCFCFNWGTWPPGLPTAISVTQAQGSLGLLSPYQSLRTQGKWLTEPAESEEE